MSEGFYLMHRGWMDNPVFRKEPFTDCMAWEWLIHEASFEPHKIRYQNTMIEVNRGQVPMSYRKLVEAFQWGIHRVRNFLELLESEGMITRKTATGFLVISICNYEIYQKPLKKTATHTTTPSTTPTATHTTTNIINGKEFKEDNYPYAHAGEFLDRSRIHDDISGEWLNDCKNEMGWPENIIRDVWIKFNGHWRGKIGQAALKTQEQWGAEWRTWYRSTNIRNNGKPDGKQPESKFATGLAGIASAKEKLAGNG